MTSWCHGGLIAATVATNRQARYVTVGWPQASTAAEPARDQALTGYLKRLSDVGNVPLEWPRDPDT
jgi:hypothetical protein